MSKSFWNFEVSHRCISKRGLISKQRAFENTRVHREAVQNLNFNSSLKEWGVPSNAAPSLPKKFTMSIGNQYTASLHQHWKVSGWDFRIVQFIIIFMNYHIRFLQENLPYLILALAVWECSQQTPNWLAAIQWTMAWLFSTRFFQAWSIAW